MDTQLPPLRVRCANTNRRHTNTNSANRAAAAMDVVTDTLITFGAIAAAWAHAADAASRTTSMV